MGQNGCIKISDYLLKLNPGIAILLGRKVIYLVITELCEVFK